MFFICTRIYKIKLFLQTNIRFGISDFDYVEILIHLFSHLLYFEWNVKNCFVKLILNIKKY